MEEKQRRLKNDILAFARRYFSPHEVEMLAHIVDPELRRQEFIKLWTLKVCHIIEFHCCYWVDFYYSVRIESWVRNQLDSFLSEAQT